MTDTPQPIQFSKEEGRYRYIEDNVVTPEECAALIRLIETHGVIGDGYGGNAHPHTPNEIFGGYSFGGVGGHTEDPDHLFTLQVMNRVRKKVKRHFRLPFLWLDFGHLVFREAVPVTDGEEVEEFSHPWHKDNQSESLKRRTHTAILYVNEGFEGGLTRFQETDFGPFREVQPKTGKVVSFDVDKNPHGVSKLISGKRYVLNMWFSTNMRVYKHHRKIFKPL
jgi:hypothetical protein